MKRRLHILLILFFVSHNIIGQSLEWQTTGMPFYGRQVRNIYTDTLNNVLFVTGEIMATPSSFSTQYICKYDGTTWTNIGVFNGQVLSVANYNGDLIVAGFFSLINGLPFFSIARYDGTNFYSMGNFDQEVTQLKVINSDLYAMGWFSQVDGISARRIAKWNGSVWTDVNGFYADTLDGHINDVVIYGGNTYVCGNFVNSLDGINHVAVYKGGIWQNVGGGILGGWTDLARLLVYKNELYMAGSIIKPDGNVGHMIQKWNDTIWSEVGAGVRDITGGYGFCTIRDMIVHNNELYIAGGFGYAGNVPATFISKWDGLKWCGFVTKDLFTLGAGAQGGTAINFYNDTLYLGIGNDTLNGVFTNRILKYMAGTYNDTCSINFTGIEQLTIENEINLYPNPSSNEITLEFNLTKQEVISFEIRNILGQIVYSNQNQLLQGKQKLEIDVSSFSNGIYFLQMQNGNNQSSIKFVKQ